MTLYELDGFVADVCKAFAQQRERMAALEQKVAALAPLINSDRLEVARACQQVGATLADLEGRVASTARAQAVNRVFRVLRARGWSLDRIARATTYSTRGVASNLERFASGTA